MLGTMESIRHVCIQCVLSLVLVHVAFSADKILYSCSFEDLSTCSLGVDTTRVTWMIGGHVTNPEGQGPSADHTWGTKEGKFVYTASSDKVKGTSLEPKLTTANFQLSTGEGVLSFYFFLWGSSGNALKVFADCDGDVSLIGQFNLSYGLMNTWARAEALITCDASFLITFQAAHNANDSFIAVDDIALTSTDRDALISVKTSAPTTLTHKSAKEPDVTSDPPKGPMSTMPTGGVYNQPQETITLSIILFLLALIFMIFSVIVHCCIWQKRKKSKAKMGNRQMSVHMNSGYNCPVSHNHIPGVIISSSGDYRTPTGVRMDPNDEKTSMLSSESGIVANGGITPASLVSPYKRVRSKTVPNKRSFEHYESIEMQSDRDEDRDEDANKEKRVLSEKGDQRKRGFLGKAHHFTRSNSLPTSPGNDFYESIDHGRTRQGPLAYQVTDLLPRASSTNTLTGDNQDTLSSNCSIPSIHSNHLKLPMPYDNLERRSPLHMSRHSPTSDNYTPASHLNLNLSGSQCNVPSLYNTMSSSQCDIASLSSYETPTSHMDSPSSNRHFNPFFQAIHQGDMYDSLNRRRTTNPSLVITEGALSTPTLPSPTSSRPSAYQTPKPKTNNPPPEYHTLDPDATSDASFERSASEDVESSYECPRVKTIQHVKSESSHDYEDLD